MAYSILLFLQAVLILPTDLAEGTDLEAHFYEVRPWFFTILALTSIAEFGDTVLHGGMSRALDFGPFYLFIIIAGVTLSIVGVLTANRRYHELLCLGNFVSMTTWMVMRFWAIG